MLMGSTLVLVLIIVFYAINKFRTYEHAGAEPTGFAKLLANKWYVDELYDALINKPLRAFSLFLSNIVERLGIDGIVNGVGKFVQYGSRQLRWIQSGQVGSYILIMVVATVLFFIVQLFEK
jgi:NADH-quinone oxidoreductase subunit L